MGTTLTERDPRLPDYVLAVPGDPLTHRDRHGDALVDAYESGHVLVFDGPWLDLDYAFLRTLPVVPAREADKALKKAKMTTLTAPVDPDAFRHHVLAKMGIDAPTARRLQQQIHSANAQIAAFLRYTFPRYRVVDDGGNTWRFTLTENEGLHFDSYGDATHDDHHVRLFVNADDRPRLWRTAYQLPDALRLYRNRLAPVARDRHPNLVNAFLNNELPWPEFPAHRTSFAPGATWLVNSQLVSHEIVYGRRLLAYTYRVDPASMNDPQKNFATWARRVRAEEP